MTDLIKSAEVASKRDKRDLLEEKPARGSDPRNAFLKVILERGMKSGERDLW